VTLLKALAPASQPTEHAVGWLHLNQEIQPAEQDSHFVPLFPARRARKRGQPTDLAPGLFRRCNAHKRDLWSPRKFLW
jgi:hypothetical protein